MHDIPTNINTDLIVCKSLAIGKILLLKLSQYQNTNNPSLYYLTMLKRANPSHIFHLSEYTIIL